MPRRPPLSPTLILLILAIIIIVALCVYIGTVSWHSSFASSESDSTAPSVVTRRSRHRKRSKPPSSRTTSRAYSSDPDDETNRAGSDDDIHIDMDIHNRRPPSRITNIIHTSNPFTTTTTALSSYDAQMLQPPLRRSPNSVGGLGVAQVGLVPINVETRGATPEMQQVGILSNGKNDTVLALYGRPTYRGSSKWLYYTGSDKFHAVRLPIMKQQRDCTSEYGCDELYDNDEVTVKGYDGSFTVTIYGLDAPRYIPYVV